MKRLPSSTGSRRGGRRSPAARTTALVLTLAVVGLSSCSDVGRDAAHVGDIALSTTEFDTWLDDLVASQPTTFLVPSGATSAEAARDLLTRWITAEVLTQVVEESGGSVTDEDRAAARDQLEASGTYAGASDESLDRLAELDAAVRALDRTANLSAEDAADLYDQGVEVSGAVCARAIIAQSAAEVDAALARVAAGRDFAKVADSVNPAGNLGPGGAVLDQDGSECIAIGPFTSGVAPEVAAAVVKAEVGVPTEPVDLGGAFASILLRPYDDVADAANALMAVAAARSSGREELQSRDDIEVASRFGRWDSEKMAVVAIG